MSTMPNSANVTLAPIGVLIMLILIAYIPILHNATGLEGSVEWRVDVVQDYHPVPIGHTSPRPPEPKDKGFILVLDRMTAEVESELSGLKYTYLKGLGMCVVYAPDTGVKASNLSQKLASMEGVRSVHPLGRMRLYSDVATRAIKARESDEYSPQTAWEMGYKGRGVSIAIMDTGVDDGHPSLLGKWIGGVDVSKPETRLWPRDGTYNADDTNGHGTTCTGIAMGTGRPDGRYMGAAPEAKLVEVRIGTVIGYAPGEVAQSFYDASLQGEEWILEHRNDDWKYASSEYSGIDVVSLSWGIDVGYSSDGKDPYSLGLDYLVDHGICVVVAAGNSGPDNDGFDGMGAADKVITVAATDDKNTVTRDDDEIASYSSRGPRADDEDDYAIDELKPDISAPGTNITQAEFSRVGDGSGNGYGPRGSGTSYATPAVAGIVALMLEANPRLTPALVKEILRATAERRGEPTFPDIDPFWNRDYGWGIVDAYRAVTLAERIDRPETIDVDLQCFITNITVQNDNLIVHGMAWDRRGRDVERVTVQVGSKPYTTEINAPWANFTLTIPISGIDGTAQVEISALAQSGGSFSLPSITNATLPAHRNVGVGGVTAGAWLWVLLLVVMLLPVAYYVKFRKK